MLDETPSIQEVVYRELLQLRKIEQSLCAAFAELPPERVPTNSIVGLLYQLAEANKRLDRVELLLDIMAKSPIAGTGTAAA
jgi:hypothetical protein